jgi:ribonuclease HI
MAIAGRVKVFFDGGWRPASGMETAVVLRGQVYVRQGLGTGSAMDAEWLALLHAVEIARASGVANPVFCGDSLAVIGQASGAVACRNRSREYLKALIEFDYPAASLRLRHVGRSQNLAGIALARLHER